MAKKSKTKVVDITKIVQRLDGVFAGNTSTYIRVTGKFNQLRTDLALFIAVRLVDALIRFAVRLVPQQVFAPSTRVVLRKELVDVAVERIPDKTVDHPGYGAPLSMPQSYLNRAHVRFTETAHKGTIEEPKDPLELTPAMLEMATRTGPDQSLSHRKVSPMYGDLEINRAELTKAIESADIVEGNDLSDFWKAK